MKPLLLSTFDTCGGAAIAALRLHRGLLQRGVDSEMLVQEAMSSDPTVHGPPGRLAYGYGKIRAVADAGIARIGGNRTLSIFSSSLLPSLLRSSIDRIDPDVIHMHWVTYGFLDLPAIPNLPKPVVWTLHDMWPFTGGCHYSGDCSRYREKCGECPDLGSQTKWDLSRFNWKRKERAYRKGLTIVAPSRWMAECARSSSLFRDSRIEVIPNGIDVNRFRPLDRQWCRHLLGLPKEGKLVLFGAVGGTEDPRKGYGILVKAFHDLRKQGTECRLAVFGGGRSDAGELPFPVDFLGRLGDDLSLAVAYGAADVFVAPSLQENLSNTVMEALACGTPCVAFDVGGMSDLVDHDSTGYLAPVGSQEKLAEAIALLLEDDGRRRAFSLAARKKVIECFSQQLVSSRYLALYEQVIRP